ncbi:hypothetical protein PHYBOEH_005348 [Phytophthora boehmeriae]|uniref:Uncharacterized protein n=1 Tax=Phytophthora boehmeriae TaxID=109152 RepID=A0A8T1X8A0_9STRA|nr:hypothetical protein PHYBOEH_005348 [Phytophthora boehmeriae]
MEVESTSAHVQPAGKKLIDVTLRRRREVSTHQFPLVLPHFDDDDGSSSDSGLDEPSLKPVSINKSHCSSGSVSNNNDEEDDDIRTRQTQLCDIFQTEGQWNRLQELQELTNANTTLTSEARDLRQQVKALQIQLEAQVPVPGMDIDTVQDILLDKDNVEHDVRDVKIVHQAKALRALKRSLQREKQLAGNATKECKLLEDINKKLEQEIDTLHLKLQRFQARAAAAEKSNGTNASPQGDSQNHTPGSPTPCTSDGSNEAGVRKLCEELKAKNVALQQELKKTQRALVREVGDDVSLEDIIGNTDCTVSGAHRRGRAQHIVMLKSKVKKLQAQLATAKSGCTSADVQVSNISAVVDVDQRAQQELSGQQIHRQKLVDQLTTQRDDLQERVHRLTRKYDALKARAQILDREKQEMRNKFQVLVEKSRNDDALVDALQRQLETWKGKLHEARRARTADVSAKGSATQEERAELERLRKIVAAHKGGGDGDRLATPLPLSGGAMPQPSEASHYRAMAAEKERLTQVVRVLKSQVEDKDKQLREMQSGTGVITKISPALLSLPPIGDERISRIPRKPGSSCPPSGRRNSSVTSSTSSLGPPAPTAMMTEKQNQQVKQEMETLRKTFRESMREKDEQITQLEKLRHDESFSTDVTSNAVNQELLDLQEENEFLRQEFDKLKTRYEALVKSSAGSTKNSSTRPK